MWPHHDRIWTVQSYSSGGTNVHPSNTFFLGPIRDDIPNGISIGSAVFAGLRAESPYSLQWAAPFPSVKIAPSHGDLDPSNTCFRGPTRVHISHMTYRSAQPFSQGSRLWQTERQPDHATPSTIVRIYVLVLRCGIIVIVASLTLC